MNENNLVHQDLLQKWLVDFGNILAQKQNLLEKN